jgi:iron complex transport system substrate-binding protein
MQSEIADLVASIEPFDPPLTYYHELDDTYYSATGNTFIGEVYGLFGLRNIADLAEVTTDFPQLSAEFIVERQPDLIFLACTVYCGTSAESVGQRPGWESIPAVVNGRVIEMNDDIVSRWGPRVVEFVRSVADRAVRRGRDGELMAVATADLRVDRQVGRGERRRWWLPAGLAIVASPSWWG